jgi:hypothetical protein
MKKFSIVLTAIVMLFTTTAFASEGDNVTAVVKAAFQTDFNGASKVSWEKTSDFYFASFMLGTVRVDAAYNEDGELVGTSRRITLDELPLNVSLELNKKYGNYFIEKGALELTYDGETSYYVNVASEKESLKLKISSDAGISVEKRSKQ